MDDTEKDGLLLDAWTATLAAQQSLELIEFLWGRIEELTSMVEDGDDWSRGGARLAVTTVAAGLYQALVEQVETTGLLAQLARRKSDALGGTTGLWRQTTVDVADMAAPYAAAAAAVQQRATAAMRARVGLDEETGPAHLAQHGPLQKG